MNKVRYWAYSIGVIALLGLFVNPIFAEISTLDINEDVFVKNDQVLFSGTVEEGSSGLVTIVIRDLNEKFVLLTQATINHDNTFEKSIFIKDRFTENGVHTANGFILNMTNGISAEFTVSLNGVPIKKDVNKSMDKQETENTSIKEPEPTEIINKLDHANFVDSSKDPLHYVERYYSEPTYKSWFDRNYPNYTIEEAVGYAGKIDEASKVQQIIQNQIIPEAQASSLVEPVTSKTDSSDVDQISLAIAGVGILFGAVYGVKRQVDSNSRQISINKNTIRKKIINPIIGSNPKEIIQTRLAKGEISLEEYEKLKSKLN